MGLGRGGAWLAVVLLMGCGEPEPAPTTTQPRIAPGADPFVLVANALRVAPEATRIRITDVTSTMLGGVDHRYTFERNGDAFVAHVACRSGRDERGVPDVTIPAARVSALLARLVGLDVTHALVAPAARPTESYPDRTFEIFAPSNAIAFDSRVQSELGEPWQVRTYGATEVIASAVPGEVMRDLIALAGDPCARPQ